ncbi:hypothetical protein EJB05_16537 [Eragrostis curvula]|uniref:Uncharacterized protein n=1 Tax=Eragrostis curvula TaxID=38414 RepID=A0A5J9VGT0_9POAL|nr:hypothetical protein EJB05_16537 [Eragrostis curvula]
MKQRRNRPEEDDDVELRAPMAQFEDLDPSGYPRPPVNMLNDSVTLVHTFEDTFGYKHGEGVWCEVSKRVSSNIDRNVVALASFSGETRVFACTGFVVEWKGRNTILTSASLLGHYDDENKITENLRIDVLLSDRRRRKGTLLHYNLHYNAALVSVEDCRSILGADVQPGVLALGRCFKSGILMAIGVQLFSWTGTLDCGMLGYSSCRITKLGIGGPLVDVDDGKIVGMNFYDKKVGTPLLLWNDIQIILNHFENIRTFAEVGTDSYQSDATGWRMDQDKGQSLNRYSDTFPITDLDKGQTLNRWPVPKPYWRHCEDSEPEDEDESEARSGFFDTGRFGYIRGMKIHLF